MSIKEALRNLLISLPAGIPYVGDIYSQYLSLTPKEQNELLRELKEELQKRGTSERKIEQKISLLKESEILNRVFIRADDKFEFLIERNFLYKFDNSDSPNYLQLLSNDFKNLFFNFFNRHNRICIVGREGVGKTFNCLLIAKILQQEGHIVYYQSIRKANLSEDAFSQLMGLVDRHFVFIIDDCQADTEKTKQIIEKVTTIKGHAGKPKFILLTRPFGKHEMKDIFGKEIPTLEFKQRFTDLEFLAKLFFQKINMSDKLDHFRSLLKKHDFSKILFKYKNMEFWNEFFRYIEDSREIKVTESELYKSAYNFFMKREQCFLEEKEVLAKLLPFFINDMPIHAEYVNNNLQIPDTQIQRLVNEGVVDYEILDWDNKNWQNDTAKFVMSKIHPTKAKIIAIILKKYENMKIEQETVLIDYMETYYENLYYIITPIYFHEAEVLRVLCEQERFVSIFKKYLKMRHLGKHLDRVIKTFSKLKPQVKEKKLFDDMVINTLAEKCNDKKFYLNSKGFLLKAVYRISPFKAYELYKKIDIDAFIEGFSNIPESKRGIVTFRKFTEIFKNLHSFYLFSIDFRFKEELDTNSISDNLRMTFSNNSYPLSDEAIVKKVNKGRWKIIDGQIAYLIRRTKRRRRKLNVYLSLADDRDREIYIINNTKKFVDGCYEEFIKRFDEDDYLTQLHWLLKNLDAMKLSSRTKVSLANYFLEKIPPTKIVEWIKFKNTRASELRYIFKIARFKFIKANGTTQNLYYDYFKGLFDYTDAKRIFDNKRSKLYDIAIISKFSYEILADYLYQYSKEDNFIKKVSNENNLYLINQSIELIENNPGLSDEQKNFIISRIIGNCNFGEGILKATIKEARKRGKRIDIDHERRQFLSFRRKYGRDFA